MHSGTQGHCIAFYGVAHTTPTKGTKCKRGDSVIEKVSVGK